MAYLVYTVLIGLGATAAVDLWALARRRLFGLPLPNYGLVGRWFAHMPRGRFRHVAIAAARPVRGEYPLGWLIHYLTGVSFAAILTAGWGIEWVRQPTLGPALIVGLGSVAAPFLLMQPGMGAGLFARLAPRPGAARLQSLVTHAMFGVGLYAAAWLARLAVAP